MYKQLTYILIVIAFITACNKDNELVPYSIDYSYFPLDTGNWIVYDITEISIDKASNVYDTNTYQIKEIVESIFYDNTNKKTYRIERYKRQDETHAWIIKDVWVANILTTTAEKVEENVRFVKLVFPTKLYNTWNGNSKNIYEEQEYQITELDTTKTINNIVFDSTLTVLQLDKENLIQRQLEYEIFAKHIGLVYKTAINVESQEVINPVPVIERVELGTIFTQTVSSYYIN